MALTSTEHFAFGALATIFALIALGGVGLLVRGMIRARRRHRRDRNKLKDRQNHLEERFDELQERVHNNGNWIGRNSDAVGAVDRRLLSVEKDIYASAPRRKIARKLDVED
jgi:hypothetical protein